MLRAGKGLWDEQQRLEGTIKPGDREPMSKKESLKIFKINTPIADLCGNSPGIESVMI
jgi:hypothetical protein